ncbi:MAG TPA: hypothetical protein PKL55_02310, partial [Syntrophales bacterium]|nr:hypothetical protein [Syntrophales bacterium]
SASSLVTATYVQVRLIPHDSRASPADLFTMPSQMEHFLTSYDVIILDCQVIVPYDEVAISGEVR